VKFPASQQYRNNRVDEKKLKNFERDLKKQVRGCVYFDPVTRGIYATDADIR